jgi:4-amino-4-deoxy-L-arabinose transferase-like glycosyltransferase
LSVIGAIDAAGALTPELANDSVNHHLAIAASFAQRASLAPGDETQVYYWQLPVQALYAGLTAVSNAAAAKVLHLFFGVLACASIGIAASHFGGSRRTGLLAALLFAVTSVVSWLATTAYLDLGHVFFFVTATLAVCRWLETRQLRWLGIAGLCSGVAIPSRLANGVVVLATLAAIAVRERESVRRILRASVAYGIPTLLAWSPWLIRSWVLSGNPVFPWMNNVFRSPLVEPLSVFAGIQFGVGNDIGSLLGVPFALTFQPEKFVELGEAGRHYLALAPALLLLARRPLAAPLAFIAWTFTLFSVLWFYFLLQNLRYLLPALALFPLLLAVAVGRIRLEPLRVSAQSAVVAIAAFSIILSSQAASAAWLRAQSGQGLPYRLVLGLETADDFLAGRVGGFLALGYANQTYHGRARIWAPYFANRLYSEAPIVFNDVFTVLPLRVALAALQTTTDASEESRRLRQLGFTHMLIYGARPEFSLPDDKRPAYFRSEFLDHYTELEFADSGALFVRLLDERRDAPIRGSELLPNPHLVRGSAGTPENWDATGHVELIAERQDLPASVGLDQASRLYSRPIPVAVGRTYGLRIHAYAAKGVTTGIFQLDFIDAGSHAIQRTWVPFYPDESLRAFDIAATAPTDAVSVRVVLGVYDAGKVVWFADASVTEIGTR